MRGAPYPRISPKTAGLISGESMGRDILKAIGNTPLLRLDNIAKGADGVSVLAKAEHLNPSGSVKDRAARGLVVDGIRRGELTAGRTILDATSGNTGIAYAVIGSALGYRVRLCLPANAGRERKTVLKALHAEIVETDPLLGTDGALEVAREMARREPEVFFYPNQYDNPANWKAHYLTTGVEIWNQTAGCVTHFVAGTGTSGTFTGTARRLKDFSPSVQAFEVQPDSPMHGLEGMKHPASTLKPGIYDPSLADGIITVATEDAAKTAIRLAREEGLFVGISSGANVWAALRAAASLPPGSVVVTILCDSGFRYLDDALWKGERP
jgi:cysteine synthase B